MCRSSKPRLNLRKVVQAMENQETRTDDLVLMASQGEDAALGDAAGTPSRQVRGMVAAEFDGRVARRVDASDLVQETFGDAVRKFPEYLHDRERIGFLGWLRQLARRRVIWAQRQHLGAAKRCAGRDRGDQGAGGSTAGPGLMSGLVDPGSSPSQRGGPPRGRGDARQAPGAPARGRPDNPQSPLRRTAAVSRDRSSDWGWG